MARKPKRDPRGRSSRKGEAARLYRGLESWIRSRLFRDLDADALPASINLKLDVPVVFRGGGREASRRRFVEQLEKQVTRVAERLEMEHLGFRAGHVYCHWCSSPICEHTLPEDERSVFVGYSPTGQPRWRDFSSWIIERRDPRVDRLFVDRPQPLAVCSSGRELVADLLTDFGRHGGPYRIVAQIAAGFFPLRTRDGASGPFALTGHLLERRQGGGEPSYVLNIVGAPPPPHHLPTVLAERVTPLLTDLVTAMRKAQRDLTESLTEARRSGKRIPVKECRTRAGEAFAAAAQTLEKSLRRDSRRTLHAQERTRDPERPTSRALSDALAAPAGDLFLDHTEDTVIVRGPRRRVHVYRRDGTHITSIVYPGETIRDRIRRGRWSPLPDDAVTEFVAGLERGTATDG